MSNPFALLADDGSDAGDSVPLPKQSKPVQVDAAPGRGGAAASKAGKIPNASTRRSVPGQTVKPQKEIRELPASDAPAGSAGQFEGERGRDDRGTGFQRGGRGGRGRGGERGRGRGGAGGRGGARGGADRPDRRSQTGREDSHKAEHQGWGGDDGKRELEAENDAVGDAAAEAKTGDAADKPANGEDASAQVNGDKSAAEESAAPAEPEDKSLTYEEYLKSRMEKSSIAGVNEINARKANEGSDDAQWKDGVRHEKTLPDEYFVINKGNEAEKATKAAKDKARKEKTFLEVEFRAPERREDRGGRGGARGGRGGRGESDRPPRGGARGAPRGRGAAAGRGRGGANSNAGINVDDSKAFPSLA